jgi:hypothetical protein
MGVGMRLPTSILRSSKTKSTPKNNYNTKNYVANYVIFLFCYYIEMGLILGESADIDSYEIWPESQGQHAFPKCQMQKTDREEPPSKPGKARETMIFNFYFPIHFFIC